MAQNNGIGTGGVLAITFGSIILIGGVVAVVLITQKNNKQQNTNNNQSGGNTGGGNTRPNPNPRPQPTQSNSPLDDFYRNIGGSVGTSLGDLFGRLIGGIGTGGNNSNCDVSKYYYDDEIGLWEDSQGRYVDKNCRVIYDSYSDYLNVGSEYDQYDAIGGKLSNKKVKKGIS